MTYEEAKEILTNSTISIGRTNGKELFAQAEIKAIEALEKQIPKKPNQDYYAEHIYYCPTCTRWLNGYHKPHHCQCGQALDWSE